MNTNKQIKWGVVLQYAQMALSIIIQLIYTPIMLKILGKTEYGIYSIASSTITYLSLLSLGFGASYIRFYSKYKVVDNQEGINKLNGLYLIVFSIIGLIALVAGVLLAINSQVLLNNSYTSEEIQITRILLLLLAINLAISFPASVFVSYVTSQEKFVFQKLLNIGKTVMAPAVSIVFLYLGYGSIGMVVVTTFLSIIIDIINVFYCLFKLKMKFDFHNPNFRVLREIFIFSIFIAINQIIDQINWQTDKLILGKMTEASAGAVAIYTVGANINNMYLQFSTAVSSVFTPKIHSIVARHDEKMDSDLNALFIKVGRVQFFIMGLILSGFIFFGQYFIYRWAGEGYEEAYLIAILLIAPVTLPLVQNLGIEIQRAKNKHQFRSIVYLIMAIINVGISIWFCYLWGAIGCAIGTAISLVVANIFIMNIYYHTRLQINVIKFWKSIVSILPSLVVPIAYGVLSMIYVQYTSLWQYGLFVIAYSIIYIVFILLLGLNKEEKYFFKSILNRFFRRNSSLIENIKEVNLSEADFNDSNDVK